MVSQPKFCWGKKYIYFQQTNILYSYMCTGWMTLFKPQLKLPSELSFAAKRFTCTSMYFAPPVLLADANFTSHYSILSFTVGWVNIIWQHISLHQIHEKMVLWKTWSHLTTKSFLILHLGHEIRFCFLVTPGMLSHGAVCVMASCMPPSLTGQL